MKSGEHHTAAEERYRTVRLLDTFFSDTMEPTALDELIEGTLRYGYSIKLLLLDPVGRSAYSRAHALGVNPIRETNKGIASLRNAIKRSEMGGRRYPQDLLERTREDSVEYLLDQLEDLRAAQNKYPIEVRFYNVLTEAPVYVFHQHALKGNIKYGVSAADNPWLVFVDDPHQSDDLYDFFVGNFDAIWDNASMLQPGAGELNDPKGTCFAIIPFSEDFSFVWESITKVADEFSLVPIRGDSDPTGQIFSKFRDGIRNATLVIADISGARPNVMFETGMSCEMEKPMIMMSRDVLSSLPRDLSNFQIVYYSAEADQWRRQLNLRLIETVSGMRDICIRRLEPAKSEAEANGLVFSVHFRQHKEVTTCSEAAVGRGISLEDELKTLIVKGKGRDVAVHLRGDMKVNPRRLKEILNVSEFEPLDVSALADKYFAETGTVCPFTKRVWQLEHIVDSHVEKKEVMYTNNGSKTGFVRFSPRVLQRAAKVRVARLCDGRA